MGLAGDTHRVVTLASIVEKETAAPDERAEVASVYANRLAKNMALAADPTVVYAALLAGNYRGAIYQSDLQSDSPYNTYKFAGLPPGPIANPGAASLKRRHAAGADRVPVLRRRRRRQRTPPLLHQLRAARAQRHRLSQGREGALMQLPPALRRAIEQELSGCDGAKLRAASARLTECYRQGEASGALPGALPRRIRRAFQREQRAAYLAVRVPATFAAAVAALTWTRESCDAGELQCRFAPCSISAAVPEPRSGRPCRSFPLSSPQPPSSAIPG